MAKPNERVQLGVIGAPHGVRGEMRVKTFTEDPMALGQYGPLFTQQGRVLEVTKIRQGKGVAIVCFAGVQDRNAAEALRGQALFVDRAALPKPDDEDEFYYSDLEGLEIVDEREDVIGKVIAVHDFGAGDVLEARLRSGELVMIPFTRDAVPEVDLKAGRIRIDRPAAGLDDEREREAMQGGAREGSRPQRAGEEK